MNSTQEIDIQDLLATIGEKEVRIRLLIKQNNELVEKNKQLEADIRRLQKDKNKETK